jgi:hypothetical protein
MEYLTFTLSRWTDRAVIDRTGLPARYDVNFAVPAGRGENGGRGR